MKVQLRYFQSAVKTILMTWFIIWLNFGITDDFLVLWTRTFVFAWLLVFVAAFSSYGNRTKDFQEIAGVILQCCMKSRRSRSENDSSRNFVYSMNLLVSTKQ